MEKTHEGMQAFNSIGYSADLSQTTGNPCNPSGAAFRLRDETGIYRVIYTARLIDAVYVLHAFQKKTQATSKRDIELARQRWLDLMKEAK